MTFAQIHAALESAEPDERFSLLGDPFPHLTALAMLTMIVRLPLVAFDPPAPGFSNRFPKNHMPPEAKAVFGKELGKYRTWRRLVLDCELLATGKGVDADHWDSLRRLARLTIGRAAAMNIYNVSARLPPDLPPWELDRRLALSVDAGLTKGQRQAYRAGLRVIDKLHFIAIAAASGLLPSDEIGRLPDLAAHDTHAPLPPKLKLFCNEAPRPVRNALMFTWRIAIASGIFLQGDDPAPQDLIAPSRFMRLSALNPQHFGFARPSNHTYSTYLRQLSRHIRPQPAFSPETDPVEAAWAALHTAAGKAGASPARLSALRVVSAAATEERLLPASLTPRWFTERLAAQPAARSNRFRHGCYLLDDLAEWGGLPASLLPMERTGLARLRARRGEGEATAASAAPASACADPVEGAWIALFAAGRAAGIDEKRLHSLYALKTRALALRLTPDVVDATLLQQLIRSADKTVAAKLRASGRLLDEMRVILGLRPLLPAVPIGMLPDFRRAVAPLSLRLGSALEAVLTGQGAAPSSRRSAHVALSVLAGTYPPRERERISLDALLATDLNGVDWGRQADQAPRYIKTLKALRAFRDLPWTPPWQALQDAIVAAGVGMRDNPVAALLGHALGRVPQDLDAAWARETDRYLRRPNALSTHGRADLALTFARNLARLDALHAVPAIAGSGLLPPPLGRFRT